MNFLTNYCFEAPIYTAFMELSHVQVFLNIFRFDMVHFGASTAHLVKTLRHRKAQITAHVVLREESGV